MDQEKLDILWKKFNGMTETSSTNQIISKNWMQESINSRQMIPSSDVWLYTEQKYIPVIPPSPTLNPPSNYVLQMNLTLTLDTTTGRSFFAYDTNLKLFIDWIPPTFGPKYAISLIDGNGHAISQTDENYTYYFDYCSGILYFPNLVPVQPITLTGYRYIGQKGLPVPTANPVALQYETITGLMNVGDFFQFTIGNGKSIKLLSLEVVNLITFFYSATNSQVTDAHFANCDCLIECHWDHTYSSENPYQFLTNSIPTNNSPVCLKDDGSYYVDGVKYSGPQFVDLITQPPDDDNNCTYWQITKTKQSGRVHLIINYIPNF